MNTSRSIAGYCVCFGTVFALACSDQPAGEDAAAASTVAGGPAPSEDLGAPSAGARGAIEAGADGGPRTVTDAGAPVGAPSGVPGAGSGGSSVSAPGDAAPPQADASDPGKVTSDAGDGGESSDAGSEPPPAVACPSPAAAPGESRSSLMHDGRMREYLTYVPSGYDGTRPVPLVLNFHGATMTAESQRDFSGMNAAADDKGFVVIYPQGVGNSWNAGVCCGEAQSSNVDDVGFARALVAAAEEALCIDLHRVYASGFSNGGRMSYRLGCEAAELFAALAPVAGTKSFPDDGNSPGCMPSQPISLIDFMGSADPRSEAQPGQIAEWVAFNGCTDSAPAESYRQGAHFCSTYSQCKDGTSVTFCIVEGGDHCWPGSYPCFLGNTSRPEELSANDLIWELFERSKR